MSEWEKSDFHQFEAQRQKIQADVQQQETAQRVAQAYKDAYAEPLTYSSTQHTKCACCGSDKHTPLRCDYMGGYVCLTCIDRVLHNLFEKQQPTSPLPNPLSPDLLVIARLYLEKFDSLTDEDRSFYRRLLLLLSNPPLAFNRDPENTLSQTLRI